MMSCPDSPLVLSPVDTCTVPLAASDVAEDTDTSPDDIAALAPECILMFPP